VNDPDSGQLGAEAGWLLVLQPIAKPKASTVVVDTNKASIRMMTSKPARCANRAGDSKP
jgi:hypothetical protein